MISIIVCSINEEYFSQLRENIQKTISVTFELIAWDNLHQGKGICEVYNMLARKARFDILLFIHEDIVFEVNGWGTELARIFAEHQDVGMIGVAGSRYKSARYSGWFTGDKRFDCASILHRYPHGDEQIFLKPDNQDSTQEVVCLDGVFICCRRKIWEEHKYDERLLKGFHFYDIDFSLRAGKSCRIIVTYDIPIVHITVGGNFGNNWMETAILYHEYYKKQLPRAVGGLDISGGDDRVIRTWLDVLKRFPVTRRNKMKWISGQKLWAKPTYWYAIMKFLLYHPLRLNKVHKLWKRK